MRIKLITSRTIYILKSKKNTKFFVRIALDYYLFQGLNGFILINTQRTNITIINTLTTFGMFSNYILFLP